jgi:PH (Pleckstrin Homology) domain-containing protein
MIDPAPPPPRPVVAVRPVSYAPPPVALPPPPLPRDPFPPQFLEPGETVLASIKPRIRAFLGVPAVALGAISVAALAGVGAVAGSSGSESALFGLFLLTFVLDNLLWSRWLGRGVLVVLPLAYFLGLIVAAAASVPTSPVNAAQTRAIIGVEIPLFAVLEILLPLGLFLMTWWRSYFAVTDQRVIEVRGVFSRSSEWIPLAHVGPVTARRSMVGRWLGYGRVRFVDRSPRAGVRTGVRGIFLGRDVVGAEFFGVGEPEQLRDQLEMIIARRAEPPPGSGDPPPATMAPSRPTASLSPAPAATGSDQVPAAARCPRCSTPLVFVAPANRFYCPSCGRYV